MSDQLSVTYTVDAENVGWITFDDPAGRANLFNPPTQAALGGVLTAITGAPPQAVVVISAKEKIFIAGADLKWLAGLPDAAGAASVAREGQALFEKLGGLKIRVVCAIHGACAGGGYELALACHWRIASDASQTVIGLPETGLGLIPGWGGCTRLPRLIGAEAAVNHILKAALVPAAKALADGLVDEVVPAGELKTRAKAAALRLAAEGRPARVQPPVPPACFFATQRTALLQRRRGQPALLAVLDAVEKGAGLPLANALELEAALFGGLATGATAKNLLHVHFLKDTAKKITLDRWFPSTPAADKPAPIRTVGIIGAGVMGSGIAHWCALHGYGVIMCDEQKAAIEQGVQVIRDLFRADVKRGTLSHEAAHKMTGGIGITTSLEDFEICDIVIEAVVENVATKQKVFAELTKIADPNCIFASNTSALPIEEVAATATEPGRVVGLHFFNPVGRMPLVELVLSPHTTRETADRALAFVKALGKTPVVCKSAPGFLVTRVLFFYLNEACRLWEQGVGTEALDAAMREWGWPMGPMRLIDEVGVDVSDFIFREMKHYFPNRIPTTGVCARMLAAGLKGRKNGESTGFYTYADGVEVPNPAVAQFAPAAAVTMPAPAIQQRLNGVMIAETQRVLAEGVVKSADEADLALLLGAGFPAGRGGLLHELKRDGTP